MSPPRTFRALRHGVDRPEPTVEPIDRVLRRVLGSGGDGQRVLEWMIAETHGPSPIGSPDAALREAEGARRFISLVFTIINKKSDATAPE